MTDIWNPMLQITNQEKLRSTLPDVARVSSDGTVKVTQRYVGTFTNPLDLHSFPLDVHNFVIQFVAAADPEMTELVISDGEKNLSGLAENLSLPNWEITEWKVSAVPVVLFEGAPTLPGASFEFEAKRYLGYYLLKVLLPLLLIVIMSWIVFWIHPSEAGSQISVSITSMLTLIAYRFALGSTLPKVSYMTRMDGLILGATLMVFLALVQAVSTSRLVKVGKEELALKIDRVCRVLFPCTFVAICVYAALR